MDKYEFNIKVEQMKKLVSRSDFETAAKIADAIDWRRVRSANLLTTVANIYEENGDYQESINILLIAFERSPGGKFLLYKLTILALKNRNISEAEAYYKEFCELVEDDSRKHILKYLLLKEKGVPYELLIPSLERYVSEELDEKWLYELAELYHSAGYQEQCVQLCDKIMLMFGLGKYVDKAMELKLFYEPLTQYQVDLMENKEKYEEKLRAVEIEYGGISSTILEEETSSISIDQEVNEILGDHEESEPIQEEEESDVTFEKEELEQSESIPIENKHLDQDIQPQSNQPEDHSNLDLQRGDTVINEMVVEKVNIEAVRQEQEMHQIKAVTPMAVEALKQNFKEMRAETILADYDHMIIESEDRELGVGFAIQTLKKIHLKKGVKRAVVKITGDKLNKRGILASVEQLHGKDLVVEYAGDMTSSILQELKEWIQTIDNDADKTVILIDNPRQIGRLKLDYPLLTDMFHINDMSDIVFEDPIPKVQKNHLGVFIKEEIVDTKKDQVELDWEEFEHYACQYASEIDCFVPEKSMIALQERIEMMEEDGIPLTKKNAEDLIEGIADKAEKSSFGSAITGIFAPKYNKEGLLVLRERHFLE